jgi:hypothetical protein
MLADDAAAFFREKVEVARSRKRIWHEMMRQHLPGRNGRGASPSTDGNGASLYRIWQANDAAALSYNAQPYPGRLTIFRAHRQYSVLDTAEAGWDEIAAGGINVRRMHVYPAGMLVQPFVRQTAAELNRCIQAAL